MINYSMLSDDELARLLQLGDREAYTEIYHRYKRQLYLFAFKRLGDREEVKDIVHEIFLSLWINHESLSLKYSLSTYLHSAVRNKILDILSRKKVSAKYVETFESFKETNEDFTDYPVRYKEMSEIIEKEIDALPPKMRMVFNLSRKHYYTRKQIAEELGLSEETVKSHIQHALKILKAKFGPMLFLIFLTHF
ncbi:RNA polymerase sigma factor [Pseudopedobacter beijingensis]|uniref:RNA polymerase sigma factor n=1 Tax=Pseudopedobacter beijingensis TaxID=1207056 RepID=A0ABW4IFG2_9SPHI